MQEVAPARSAEPVAEQRRLPPAGRTRTIRTAVVAAAVVAGIVASMLSARPVRRGSGPVPPAPPGATPGKGTPDAAVGNAQGPYTIVYGDPGIGITIAPPGASTDRYFAMATLDAGPLLPVTIGAAFVAGGTAYVLARPFVGAPRPIGKADRIFLTREGFVGLERDGPTGRTGQDVGLDGSAAGDPFALPPGYEVVGRVPTGIVVWQAAGQGSLRV